MPYAAEARLRRPRQARRPNGSIRVAAWSDGTEGRRGPLSGRYPYDDGAFTGSGGMFGAAIGFGGA